MFKKPHPESSMTKKSFSLVILSIIFVCLSMATYNASFDIANATRVELTNLTSLNDFLEKIAHSKIDMCNHTYEYICSNFPSSSQNDKERNEKQLRERLDGDWAEGHNLLRLAKRTFKYCDAETFKNIDNQPPKVEEDWHVVSEIVNDLGGWPLVQNASRVSWNSSIFNWMDTICELRKIGIPSVLLKLSVFPNPKKKTDNDKKCPLFKLDIITNDYYKRAIIIENKMVHLVRMFQLFQPQNIVLDEPKVREAYKRVVEFAEKLNKFTADLPKDSPSYICTIKEIIKETVPIDWLKLLNGLSGRPTNVILNEEVQIAFPEAHKLKKFIQFIEDTPKEVVANYIIWTVVYELLPYLRENARHEMGMLEVPDDFCLTEIEKRFELSPISILADQEYFPPSFRADINDFLRKVKDAAIEFVKERTLIRNVTETEMIVNETLKLKVQIARPEEYYNMSELDARMDPEMISEIFLGIDDPDLYYRREARRFLTQILLLNRINDFVMFNKVLQQKPAAFDLEYLKSYSITYLRERNIIFVPRVVFQRLYSRELYGFVNWARLGTTLLSFFFNKFEEHREYRRENNYTEIMEKLLIESYSSYLQTAPGPMREKYSQKKEFLGKQSAKQVLAGEAALLLYHTTNLGQYTVPNQKSLRPNYSPEDVTWMLMASTFCFRSESYDDANGNEMVFYILFENTFFKQKFMKSNCSSNSKIHRFDERIKTYHDKKVKRPTLKPRIIKKKN